VLGLFFHVSTLIVIALTLAGRRRTLLTGRCPQGVRMQQRTPRSLLRREMPAT